MRLSDPWWVGPDGEPEPFAWSIPKSPRPPLRCRLRGHRWHILIDRRTRPALWGCLHCRETRRADGTPHPRWRTASREVWCGGCETTHTQWMPVLDTGWRR